MIREKLEKKVKEQIEELINAKLEKDSGLLRDEAQGINYHTAVEGGVIHYTRECLSWLPGFLRNGTEEAYALAAKSISRVLALQDKDEESPAYGIWPYLFEEPLDKMKNPDWNWSPFLGTSLLILWKEYKEKLPTDLVTDMEAAIKRACESIIRRKMGVDYTNISLMSAQLLTLTGEMLENSFYFEQGLDILKKQLEFVELNGGFAEYNSPTYGVLDVEEAGRILYYTRNDEVRRLAEKLHYLSWKVFAEHYHPATGQVAPPHARCYDDIQGSEVRTLITIGTDGACELEPYESWQVNSQWLFMTLQCPEELQHYFKEQDEERILKEDFYKGVDTIEDEQLRVLVEKGTPPLSSYTYFTPQYCLGTFRRHDMWNQRRPLMAYFQTGDGVVCFRVRCMHDKMDFSGAVLETAQEKNAVAASVGFVTDHGDYHYILTPIEDGKITADCLSLDFVAEGAAENVRVCEVGSAAENGSIGDAEWKAEAGCNAWELTIGENVLHLQLLSAVFGKEQIRVEQIDEEGKKGVRLILFEGKGRELNFKELEEAYAAFFLSVTGEGQVSDSYGCICRKQDKLNCCLMKQGTEWDSVPVQTKPGLYIPAVEGEKKEFKCGGFRYVKESA